MKEGSKEERKRARKNKKEIKEWAASHIPGARIVSRETTKLFGDNKFRATGIKFQDKDGWHEYKIYKKGEEVSSEQKEENEKVKARMFRASVKSNKDEVNTSNEPISGTAR